MGAIDSMTRSDLLEIIDDRAGSKATIITSQLPNTGMPGSAAPPSPTPSWAASCSAITASRWPATRCAPKDPKRVKRREISSHRDRTDYNLAA